MNNEAPRRLTALREAVEYIRNDEAYAVALREIDAIESSRRVDPPAARTGSDLTILDVLKAAANYVINTDAKRQQSTAETRELIIKGLTWAIYEVESIPVPAAPDERDEHAIHEIFSEYGDWNDVGRLKTKLAEYVATVRAEPHRSLPADERDKALAHELADCASKCDREGFETLIVRALATVRAEGEKAAFKDCITELCIDCAEGDEPAFDAQAKWYYHEVGTKMEVGCSASKLRIRVAALESARTGKVEG